MAVSESVVRQILDDMVEEVSTIERAISAKYEGRTSAAEKAQRELAQAVAELKRDLQDARAELASLQRDKATLIEQLSTARTDASALRQDVAGTRASLEAERAAKIEKPEPSNDDAQTAQSLARIEHTLAAIASRPVPAPPTYEMLVTGRDVNNRPQHITLKPKE